MYMYTAPKSKVFCVLGSCVEQRHVDHNNFKVCAFTQLTTFAIKKVFKIFVTIEIILIDVALIIMQCHSEAPVVDSKM